jgi:hypothetical protein
MSDVALERLAVGRSALERWQTTAEFATEVEALAEPIKSDKLFNQSAMGFLLDAMILAEFVELRPTKNVRLVGQKEQWPDGQIGTPQDPVGIEITEVMERWPEARR